ncbi:hypothetical protein JCM10207_008149 [Rhodosporidiobolus poonsookiae]
MSSTAVLSQGVGYGVVLGIGLFFTILMIGLTWITNRYTDAKVNNAAEFASASHSVKPGLIATGIVSAWTWAATLLTSAAKAYSCGISGAWWYAAGATVQVLLFAQNAAKLKMNAPNAHTYVEVLRTRWPGYAAHFTFLFFAMATNVVVSSMLITGSSVTFSQLTGMSVYAACFLTPLVVTLYVVVGGMRSSLLADYIHTSLLMCIILGFLFTAYATSDKIGSPGKMWELLQAASERAPIEGNKDGSYLTMMSKSGGVFGIINVVGNFATVFLDQAYWQRAVASKPVTAVRGFALGGTAWFCIPFAFATTLGLAAAALPEDLPFELSPSAVSAGLPAPAAAVALLGKTGAALLLVILFLAVTSATAAELVAVGSNLSYDVYVALINPKATDKQILRADHISVVAWGLFMGVLGVIFHEIGISMGWLYEAMGTALGSAVAPCALGIMSSRANKWFCIAGCWIGVACGITAWMVATYKLEGEINIVTTGADYPNLCGNLVSLGVSAVICVIGMFVAPEHYDFASTRALHAHPDELPVPPKDDSLDGDEAKEKEASPEQLMSAAASITAPEYDENTDPIELKRAHKQAVWASLILFVILLVLIPVPLAASGHVYPKGGFYAWVIVGFIWVFYGSAVVILYPLWESRKEIREISGAIWADITGKGKQATVTVS